MTVQAREQMLDFAEQSILNESSLPIAPALLVKNLKSRGIDEYSIRAAIWFLIDGGKIVLTPDRMLVART
jgi:hypothetical protein